MVITDDCGAMPLLEDDPFAPTPAGVIPGVRPVGPISPRPGATIQRPFGDDTVPRVDCSTDAVDNPDAQESNNTHPTVAEVVGDNNPAEPPPPPQMQQHPAPALANTQKASSP